MNAMNTNNRAKLKSLNKIVIKLGTKVLVDEKGQIVESRIESIVKQCAELLREGKQITIVSSGAVGAGLKVLKREKRPDALHDKQMAAAVGQAQLVALYERLFSAEGFHVGQVLLTHDNLKVANQRENAKNTMLNLLAHKVVPIVNENDVVSVEELKFGDNDRLAAMVTELIGADLLVLLTTVQGLENNAGERVSYIPLVSEKERSYVKDSDDGMSLGGMASKLTAAMIAVDAGSCALIANGLEQNIIEQIFSGKDVGTLIGNP